MRDLTPEAHAYRLGFLPPPDIPGSVWAEKFRVLSREASASPGPWRNDRTPYGREILDAATDPAVEKIVLMMGAQVFKSEGLLCILGQDIHLRPGPTMFLLPDEDTADKLSRRFDLMVRDTPILTDLVAMKKSRSAKNSISHKEFPGGAIDFGSANSPSFMASSPIRYLNGDEIDRYATSSRTEGDPLTIASARLITFHNRRTILASTPLLKGVSAIEREYHESDMRRYHVPCLKCGGMQVLMWKHLLFDVVKDKVSGKKVAKNAVYECETCGHKIPPGDKFRMLAEGQWIAQADFNGTAGFWLNGLNSPFMTWEDVATRFLAAKRGGPTTLQPWVNTILAETWEEEGERIEPTSLLGRRESYTIVTQDGHVPTDRPEGVELITAGGDTHDDNVTYTVYGWGRDRESWLLEWGVITGNTKLPVIRDLVGAMLAKKYRGLPISGWLQDSKGHRAEQVYEFCKRYEGAYAAAGQSTGQMTWGVIQKSQTKAAGRGVLYNVNVDAVKRELFNALQVREPGPMYCHFPMHADQELFAELTSEVCRNRPLRGFENKIWEKLPNRANHLWDCSVYARALLSLYGGDLNLYLDALAVQRKRAQDKDAGVGVAAGGGWMGPALEGW